MKTQPLTTSKLPLLLLLMTLCLNCSDETVLVNPAQDCRPPQIDWIAPEAGSTLSDTVNLQVGFYDENGVDSVKLYLNGALFNQWDRHSCLSSVTDTTFTLPWNTLDFADGVYILEARAWDIAGNLGTSPSLMVKVQNGEEPPPEDRTPPIVLWIEPVPNSVVSGMVLLGFQALDNVGVDSLRLYKNGSSCAEFFLSGHTDLDYQLLWNTTADTDGVYIFDIRAWDASFNMGRSALLSLQVMNDPPPPEDNTPPDLWWEAPEGGATLRDTVTLRLRWFDESGVDSVRFIRNGSQRVVIPTQAGIQTGMVEYLWDTRTDSDGVHLWEARGWDSAGNQGASTALLVRVANDTTSTPPEEDGYPPVVSWLSPEAGSEVSGTVHLRFQVMDASALDSVIVYLGGRELLKLEGLGSFLDADVEWLTSDYVDGNYTVEVRAWDASGNMGSGVGVSLTVRNNVPRVIWVPDDYETIQGAINASEDGDTVRVRAGTYNEGLRLMGKNIWLESEEGPEVTIINSQEFGTAIFGWDGEDNRTAIRGFRILGGYNGINLAYSAVIVYNCIITSESAGVFIGDGNGQVYNCVLDSCLNGISCAYTWGKLRNSIFLHCELAIDEFASNKSYLDYGWSLFWDNQRDYNGEGFDYVESDVMANPQFIPNTYILSPESSAINAGDPLISDTDGSCSDIGVYGGPYAYPIP